MNNKEYLNACYQIQDRLSGFLDGELDSEQTRKVQSHLFSCSACQKEWKVIQSISQKIRYEGRRIPPAPEWDKIERELSKQQQEPNQRWKPQLSHQVKFAAAAALVLIFTCSFYLTKEYLRPTGKDQFVETPFGLALGLYIQEVKASDPPVLSRFLAVHQAQAIPADQLIQKVGFWPFAPEQLPGGLHLEKSYVLATRCCNGVYLRYIRGNEVIALFQQAPGHPIEWEDQTFEDRIIARVPVRRAKVGDLEIVQIEPQGKNLTFVARRGKVDIENLVAYIVKPRRMG